MVHHAQYDNYPLGELRVDRTLTQMFVKFLHDKKYKVTLVTTPDMHPKQSTTGNRTPSFGRHKHTITIHNYDGKLVALLHKYGLTAYTITRQNELRLVLDFPETTCKLNTLLASEK